MLGLVSLVSRGLRGSRLGVIIIRRLVGIVGKLAATTGAYGNDIIARIPGKAVSNRLGGGLTVGVGGLEGIVTVIEDHREDVFLVGNEVNNLILGIPGHPGLSGL